MLVPKLRRESVVHCQSARRWVKTADMGQLVNNILLCVLAGPLLFVALASDCAHQQATNGQTTKRQQSMNDAIIGTWGGEHIRMEVTAEGAQIEYDCAHGTIDQKFVLDAQGRFDLTGTHVREHGGPVRRDEQENRHPARYKGQIKGETMTLTVTESDTDQSVGTFNLTRGQQGHVTKCR